MTLTNSSMLALMAHHAEQVPDRPAFLNDTETLSWKQAFDRTRSLAAYLHDCGVSEKETVLVFMPRTIDTGVVLVALRALGALVVLLPPEADTDKDRSDLAGSYENPWFLSMDKESRLWTLERGGQTFRFLTKDVPSGEGEISSGKGLCEEASSGKGLCEEASSGKEPCEEASSGKEPCEEAPALSLRMETQPDEPSVVIYTAGSTGLHKGVVLSEYALVNQARFQGIAAGVTPDDRTMCVAPMNHITGVVDLLHSIDTSCSIFLASTRYPKYILKAIQEYRCTRLDGVPTIFMMLVEATKDPGVDLSSLKSGVMAGSSYSPEQFQAIEEALHICLYPSYGMTEMSPIICSPASDAPFDVRSRSVGSFAYGVTGVLKTRTGEHVTGTGQEGEICVRGYMLMLGYHEDDGTLTRPVDEEGFFHTGDLGYLDEQGNLHITGRCKDIIIRGGENISCARIHSCVTRLPGVYDAVVMGIPDPKYGEAVGIFAVTDSYDEAGLLKDLGTVLRSCEMPASLIVSDKMPVNAAAKPDRKTIKLLLEKAAKKGVL